MRIVVERSFYSDAKELVAEILNGVGLSYVNGPFLPPDVENGGTVRVHPEIA